MAGQEVWFLVLLGVCGSVSEWFKEHAWKACVRVTVPEVRILSLPPGRDYKNIPSEEGIFL